MAHEIEKIVVKIKQAKAILRSAVSDIEECGGDDMAEIEEWKNEAENAIDEIKAIAERMV